MFGSRSLLFALVCSTALLLAKPAPTAPKTDAAKPAEAAQPAPAAAEPPPAPAPAAEQVPAPEPPPPAATPAGEAPAAPAEPLYSLEAGHQDAVSTIMEYARRANQPVTVLDKYPTRVNVRFKDLPFEKGLKKLLESADLDFIKDAEGYTVGLPSDLALRFPRPDDKVVDGTYRCRRISAPSLVKTIKDIMGEADIRATIGPEFLTPALEDANTGAGDQAPHALKATDSMYHTHDVVFSGTPAMVRRALSLARKFDRPRRQVRVDVRIVEIKSNADRNLGIQWFNSGGTVKLTGTENTPLGATTVPGAFTLGSFNHSPLSLTATLTALEDKGDAKILSNPSLLVLDGEKSFILSGTKYLFPKITNRDSTGQPVYDVDVQKLGVYLQVGVQVGLDDDVTLNVYPQVTSLTGTNNIQGVDYPIIATSEEEATIRAAKGQVIVLGGLKIDDRTYDNAGVPWLASLPVLGRLFGTESRSHTMDDLLFFLTPEILETDFTPPLDVKIDVK